MKVRDINDNPPTCPFPVTVFEIQENEGLGKSCPPCVNSAVFLLCLVNGGWGDLFGGQLWHSTEAECTESHMGTIV